MNTVQKSLLKTCLNVSAVIALSGSLVAYAEPRNVGEPAILVAANDSAAVGQPQKQESLYARLGGYDAIAAVVDDLVQRLAADPKLGRFWANRGADGIRREKQLVVNFVVDQAGGPLFYSGRDMVTAHLGMKISDQDWHIFIKHLRATLEKFKVPDQEKTDVISFMEGLKKTMVE